MADLADVAATGAPLSPAAATRSAGGGSQGEAQGRHPAGHAGLERRLVAGRQGELVDPVQKDLESNAQVDASLAVRTQRAGPTQGRRAPLDSNR